MLDCPVHVRECLRPAAAVEEAGSVVLQSTLPPTPRVQLDRIKYPNSTPVTPAKAGVQSYEGCWIPACAGMTCESFSLNWTPIHDELY